MVRSLVITPSSEMVDEVASHLAPTVYPYLLGRRTTLTTQVDEVASNLVCSGARTHRRKLVRALLQPPRHRPEVLPHYPSPSPSPGPSPSPSPSPSPNPSPDPDPDH